MPTKAVTQADLERACALAADSLAAYCQLLWPQYKLGRHLTEITRTLEAVERGDASQGDPDRVILLCPPRHSKPVSVDVQVLMADGSRKKLGEIQVGDEVISGAGRQVRVTEVHEQGILPVGRVTTHSGRSTVAAWDHAFLTPAGWRQLSDIRPKESLACLEAPATTGASARSIDEFRLLGYFIGDGNVTFGGRGENQLAANITQQAGPVADDIAATARGLGFEVHLGAGRMRLSISGGVRQWLRDVGIAGCNSYTKRVPAWVFSGSTEQIAAYVAAHYDCDGCVTKKGNAREGCCIELYSVSRELLSDVQHLLLRLGIMSRVRRRDSKVRGVRYPAHVLAISDTDNAAKFAAAIPLLSHKGDRIREWAPQRTRFSSGHLADPVVEIVPFGTAECRCLTVSEDESFTADDLIVHNSMTTSQFFPSWFLGRNPDKKVIIGACSQSLSEDFGIAVRNNMQDPLHRMTFPRCRLSTDSQAKEKFTTTRGGQFFAVGRGSTTVGRGAHLFIVDDPIRDQEEAQSEELRRKLKSWFTSVAYTRLMPQGRIVICQTLWHEDDLAGWLMRESEDNWRVLRFPAIAEEDEAWRKKGEALWPEQYPLKTLERIRDKSGMTTSEWMSLYQQRAVGDDGAVFKLKWFRDAQIERELVPQQSHHLTKYILVDPANSKRKGSDYTSMWVVGLGTDKNVYVLDGLRDRLGLRERANELFRLHRTWKPVSHVFYEEYGLQADIQYVRERQHGVHGEPVYTFNIKPVGGKVRKEDRIRRLEPWFRDKRIKMPRFMPRISNEGKQYDLTRLFEEEYKSFPVGAHDDMFDCLARISDPEVQLNWPQTQEEVFAQNAYMGRMLGDRTSWMSA